MIHIHDVTIIDVTVVKLFHLGKITRIRYTPIGNYLIKRQNVRYVIMQEILALSFSFVFIVSTLKKFGCNIIN